MTRLERVMLRDYYYRGLTQVAIAVKWGVKLWRVRRLTQRNDPWKLNLRSGA